MNKQNAFEKACRHAQELFTQGYYPDIITFKNPNRITVYAKKRNEEPIKDDFPYKEASYEG